VPNEKVERREKTAGPGQGARTAQAYRSFIRVHLRSSAANIGFASRAGPAEKHIWPQMNADERR